MEEKDKKKGCPQQWWGQQRGPTYDGQDDYDKVKHVPAHGEVVATQCYQLQDALASKDDNEDDIDPVEDKLFLRALFIRLHHHSDHVEADQHHDEHVKDLQAY